jgi:hypothetical protein
MDGSSLEQVNWACGLALIGLTLTVHVVGVVVMAFAALRLQVWIGNRESEPRSALPLVVTAITIFGMLLVILHGVEASIWAGAYLWLGALKPFNTALFYSVDSMTTRGASGLPLAQHWLMLGALEAVNGMLLFGISTAFIFGLMQAFWPLLAGAPNIDQAAQRRAGDDTRLSR